MCAWFNYFYLKFQVSRKFKFLESACAQKEFIFLYQITPLGFSNIINFRYCLFQQSIAHNWFMLQKCDLSYLNCVNVQMFSKLPFFTDNRWTLTQMTPYLKPVSKIDNDRSKDAMLLLCFAAMGVWYPWVYLAVTHANLCNFPQFLKQNVQFHILWLPWQPSGIFIFYCYFLCLLDERRKWAKFERNQFFCVQLISILSRTDS